MRPAVQPRPAAQPEEGKISKFKPDVTFNGTESLESFLFALNQSLAAYNLNSDHNRKLALGRSLRGDALEWWTDNATLFDTFNESVDAMHKQYKDLAKPGDHIRKINRLVQTSTTREFFRTAEKLNRYAKLPDEALWKTLKEGLKAPLRTSLATLRPRPATFGEWKQAALELGAELDAIQINTSRHSSNLDNYRTRPRQNTETDQGKDSNANNKKYLAKQLSHALKEDQRKRNTCYTCGEEGHRAADCPTKNARNGLKKSVPQSDLPKKAEPTKERKRKQGEPHYPPSKRQDTKKDTETGSIHITELDSANNSEDDSEKD